MTSSCILGFQATRPAAGLFYSPFVYCTLASRQQANRKVFLRQTTTVPDWISGRKSLPWEF